MKKLLLILLITSMPASAMGGYWHCESTSSYSGYGWWDDVNKQVASEMAYDDCMTQTPDGYSCSNPICTWYN